MTDQPLLSPDLAPPSEAADGGYRVLARTYRPTHFDDLIGQEVMVRTLRNAFASGRLAHAFILTGVRGVGKTTTARIIARGLNCTGRGDAPTADPCGDCENCRAIGEDRHVDVLEMDAASRTGVDDIRELIDGVRYRPVTARYKVYIIDEVHMLSRNAFNALLKTLEEPPAHVRFIFATTEIRKVPVTVLSRCQRFDLRRVETAMLAEHLQGIAGREGATLEPGAAGLLARAADGSVRDGLSLLDQAIALADAAEGPVTVREEALREMLGLADRTALFDLFDALMRGAAAEALDGLAQQYNAGADPATVLQDLLELAHWLTRLKIVPAAADDPGVPEVERVRGREMAGKLTLAVLNRVWQMLLKGLEEARFAPQPMAAAEMVLIRLCHAADLPTPLELVEAARGGKPAAGTSSTTTTTTAASRASARAEAPSDGRPVASAPSGGARAALAADPRPAPEAHREAAPADSGTAVPEVAEPPAAVPDSFEALVQLVADRREPILGAHLRNNVHLVHYAPGRLEYRPAAHAPADLPRKLSELLQQWTGRPWFVTTVNEGGAATLLQQQEAAAAAQEAAIGAHPVVQAVLQAFPGASIESIRPLREADTALAPDDELVGEDAMQDMTDDGASEEDDA